MTYVVTVDKEPTIVLYLMIALNFVSVSWVTNLK